MRLAVKETETKNLLETLANKSPVGLYIVQDGRFCYTNPTFQSTTGYTEDELVGRDALNLVVPEDRERVRENAIKMLKGELALPYQFRVIHKNGSIKWVMESVVSVQYLRRRATLGDFIDITERKRVEEKMEHLNLVLRAIRDINQLIARGTDRDGLLKGACDTFVKTHGYYNAWIALLDESGKLVTAAEAGLGKSFLRVMERLKRGELTPCGCKVLEKPGVLVMKDVSSECEDCPVAKEDAGRGAMSVRLEYGGKVYGLMTVSIPPGRAAEKEEHDLLEEIAGDIAFALYSMEQEQERKQAEEELQEAEAEKSALLEGAPVAILNADLKGKITYVNKRFESESGYSREEIVGKNGLKLDWLPAGTIRYLTQRMAVRLRGRPGKHWETQLKCKDGRWIWIEIEGKVLRKSGVPVGFQIIARNITERKQAEETLQAERNKLQSLVDAMEDTITIQDTEYNIIYQNEPSRIASGGDHLGEKCYRAYEGRETVCDGCPVEKAFKDGKSHTAERRTTMEGKVTFWENTANPIRDAGGKIVSCLELTKDITERKRAEEVLQTERNKLQSLIDAMEDGLTIQDRDYNIIYQNEPSRISSGGDRMGEKCYRVYEGRESICEDCPLEKVFKDGKSHTAERQRVLPSGELSFWENTANPIRDARGRVVSCLEIGRNITERKQAEEELSKTQAQLSSAVQMAHLGPWEYDAINDLFIFNDAFYELFHTTAEEVGGYTMSSAEYARRFVHPEDAHLVGEEVRKALQADDPNFSSQLDHRIIYANGEVGYISVRFFIVKDETGRTVRTYGVNQDITERKQAEEALQVEKNKLQSVIDAMADSLTIQDREYNIIFQNEPSKIIYGDHPGEKCYRIYAGREKKCTRCPVEKSFKDGKPRTVERRKKLPSGEAVFWEITANPIRDAGGRIVSCLEIGRDVTERKKQEQALADELTRRRILVDQSLDGIVVLDVDAKVVEANQRFAEMLGYTHEEVLKLHTWDWDKNFPPEEILEMGRNVDERGLHLETKHTRKDGSVIDVDISINAAIFGEQKFIFCVCRDITERKQAKETLQAEKNKLQSLIDAMDDGLTIQDRHYNIIYQNESLKEILGDQLGEKCYRAYAHKDKVCDVCPLAMAFRDGKSHTVEKEIKLPSGKVVFWEPTANPVRDAKGKIVSCLEIIRDITERKQQEQALADELTRRRILVDQSLDGIVVLDEEARVVEANQRFAEMLGYTHEEVLKLHTWDWDKNFPPEEILEMGRNVDEKGLHLETKHTRKDSSVIDVDISINGTVYGGQKLIFCVCRDITERKQADEALKESEESYRELADSITEVFFAMDEHLRYTYWNKASEILTGIRAEDALGKSLPEVFPDSPGTRMAEKMYRAVLKTHKAQIFVNNFDIDGRHYIFEISAYPSRGGVSVFVRDITERKRAEEALRESEVKLSSILDNMADVVWSITWPDGKRFFLSPSVKKVLGHDVQEFVEDPNLWEKILHPDDRSLAENAIEEIAQRGKAEYECRIGKPDGSTAWISIQGHLVYDNDGKAYRMDNLISDITERKEMEEAINLQRAYFRQLFDNSPDAIIMTDMNSKVIQVNKGFEVLFGYSNEEAKGQSLTELIVPKTDVQESYDSFQRISAGEVVRHERVRRRKDGSLVDVSVLAYPIRSNGKLIGLYGIYSDITERKRSEEAIKHAAEEWRETFDSITDAISIHDRDFRILRANKAFADTFHKKPSQIIGRYCYELHKGDKPISGCPHKQTLATKKPAMAEFYESNLGKYLHESTSPIFDEKGEVVGTVHISRDITEQKQQSERLMMADRLASIGELASGTAHELNNPLTSVIGFSQLLMEKDIPDDAREDVELIYNEAQRAANVTRSLLTFGRKHAPVKQLTQINKIIEDVLKLRTYEHNVNSIEIQRRLAPDLPEIMVDYFQMQQVFLNIIINAEYFMTEARKRGTLTITTKKQNNNVRISIADDGPGISRENLSRIFNPFFTTKEAGKGTGLGLSICHGIVSEHGGQIYARSQQDKGATIIVELPINNL